MASDEKSGFSFWAVVGIVVFLLIVMPTLTNGLKTASVGAGPQPTSTGGGTGA